MDLSMPGMDGFEAMRRINEESRFNRYTPIYVLTAHADEQTKKSCLRLGAREVVTKPINPQVLFEILNEVA
jgi:CheY-like chemotaxis protein